MAIVGMGLFTLGAEQAMQPIGETIGADITKSRKLLMVVVISFLMLSNGASAMRGYSAFKAGFFNPSAVAKFTSAHSVGSPTAFSVSELNNLTQDTDQHSVISLFFVNLPGHQTDQSPLFCI